MPDDEVNLHTELIAAAGVSGPPAGAAPTDLEDGTITGAESAKPKSAAEWLANPQAVLQSKFPEYEIGGVLGRGGMGTVYRVRDDVLGREVALKVLHPELMRDDPTIEKFVNEARITAQLDRPNIPSVYALESKDTGFHVFTMKLLEGRTLHSVVEESECAGRDGTAEVVEILLRVCDALAFAHSKGVLHLDLKPSNVIVGDFGQIYLVDWGIAKRKTDLPKAPVTPDPPEGTPSYMAPEQAKGEQWKFDERTDIFALGALLYRTLSGRAPYASPHSERVLALAAAAELEPPDVVAAEKGRTVPGRLAAICIKAMAPDPAQRYQSVQDFQQDLERYARGLSQLPQRTYQAGEVIFTEGDPGDAAYVIVSGECAVTRLVRGQTQELRRLKAGEMFGEAAVFIGTPRSATVRAVADTIVGVVEKALLVEEMERKIFMSLAIRTVTSTFLDLDGELARQRQRSQVIELALRHAARHGERGRTPWEPLLAMLVQRTGASEEDITTWLLAADGIAIDDKSLFLLG